MQIWEDGSGKFPFATLRTVGWLLVVLSLILVALGIVDVAWTAVKYVACDTADFASWPTDPCDHDDLIYTWIAVAIWCGVAVLIAGIVGTRFSKWQYSNIRQHRDTFSILCGVCALLFIPAIIVVTALEFWKAEGMGVYTYDTDDKLEVNDGVKFGIPLAILVIAGLSWFVALAGLVMGCWCSPLGDIYSGARAYGGQSVIMPQVAPMQARTPQMLMPNAQPFPSAAPAPVQGYEFQPAGYHVYAAPYQVAY